MVCPSRGFIRFGISDDLIRLEIYLDKHSIKGEKSMASEECPKCHGHMEEGFIADQSYAKVWASKWVEGRPEKSFWTGTKMIGKKQVEISAYRCQDCGYLESYAK